jgi:hypothetical protein
MSKAEEETKSEEVLAENNVGLEVYNFPRHSFSVEASSLEEAEKALEKHLKEQEKESK